MSFEHVKLGVLGWASYLVAIIVAGLILSALTLQSARSLPTTRTGAPHGVTLVLRKLYAVVLFLTCLGYYLSLPFMLAVVVGLTGLVLYAFLAVGHIPVKIALILIVVCGVTVWATFRSLFIRVKELEPDMKLDLRERPELRAVLDEVAARVGTRPVDVVYMVSGATIAVFERGGMLSRMLGRRGERCLILGAGALKGLRLIDFKAILAHEYGHFQNEDTAGGSFALAARRSAHAFAVGLATGGAATWYNPAWWMVRGYYALFLRVSHGASRLQEILADRWAAFSYGAEAFERGLRHVIRRDIRFSAVANAAIAKAAEEQEPIKNLYALKSFDAELSSNVEQELSDIWDKETSAYDSHPAPRERVELVRRLDAPTPATEDVEARAWSLFPDRRELERALTQQVLERIAMATGLSFQKREPRERRRRAQS